MAVSVRLAAFASLVVLVASTQAEATVVRALSLAQKTSIAPLIVLAQVEKSESKKDPDAARIETLIEMKVLEVLKGDVKVGQRIKIRQAGGQVGELKHDVPGQSKFTRGEQAVLFLEPLPSGAWVELGVGIGKYGVVDTPKGKMVTHDPKVGLAVFEPGKVMRVEEAKPMQPVKLPVFLARVRELAKGAAR